jgi:threonyl-tRNA synthetase
LPISQPFIEAAQKVVQRLSVVGVRVKIDDSGDKVGAKIRLARLDRVPYMLVLGAREIENNEVSVRHRDRDDLGTQSVDDFVAHIQKEISERSL